MQPFSFKYHTVLENKKQIYIYLHPNLKMHCIYGLHYHSFHRKRFFTILKISIFSLGLKSNSVDCVVFTDLCATSSEEKQGAVMEAHSFK